MTSVSSEIIVEATSISNRLKRNHVKLSVLNFVDEVNMTSDQCAVCWTSGLKIRINPWDIGAQCYKAVRGKLVQTFHRASKETLFSSCRVSRCGLTFNSFRQKGKFPKPWKVTENQTALIAANVLAVRRSWLSNCYRNYDSNVTFLFTNECTIFDKIQS